MSVLPVSATPATSMQTASPCTSASLRGEQTRQAGRFAEHARRPPCVIMSPGSQGHAANRHMHSGNNPQSSSMEFQRAGGRRINGRNQGHEREQQSPAARGRAVKITRSPLRPLWQVVIYSTLPGMAAPLGYSCWTLLWEPCCHFLWQKGQTSLTHEHAPSERKQRPSLNKQTLPSSHGPRRMSLYEGAAITN